MRVGGIPLCGLRVGEEGGVCRVVVVVAVGRLLLVGRGLIVHCCLAEEMETLR